METKNLVLAVVLSALVIFTYQIYFAPVVDPDPTQGMVTTQDESQSGEVPVTTPELGVQDETAVLSPMTREELIADGRRIPLGGPDVRGTLNLTGGYIDDITLNDYRETIDPASANITLLSPRGAEHPYYVRFGWLASEGEIATPGPDSIWQSNKAELSPESPVTLTWENGDGLVFVRHISLDEHYMMTVTQRVVNESDSAVTLAPYGQITRVGTPETLGFYILHEGLIGVLEDSLLEIDYDDLAEEDGGTLIYPSTGGWVGITDKYWLVALVPDQAKPFNGRYVHSLDGATDRYATDILYEGQVIGPGEAVETTSRVFAGAKEVVILDDYETGLGINDFDLAVDFGWFYFLTKPLFYALHFFTAQTGNLGIAILILVVCIKIVIFPLANKSFTAMAKMRKLQPQMLELRERFADDKAKLNQEMMALYKREKVNPLAGCLPIFVQIPVFFSLYKVMFVTIEMRQAPFYGWVTDLSVPDPTSIFNGFGLLPWAVPDLGLLNILSIGIWPLLMGITMWGQMRLNPQPPDPMQARIFALMPIFFTFLLATFPAGLVIYWTWNNLLTIFQQAYIMKRAGVPIGRGPKPEKKDG